MIYLWLTLSIVSVIYLVPVTQVLDKFWHRHTWHEVAKLESPSIYSGSTNKNTIYKCSNCWAYRVKTDR